MKKYVLSALALCGVITVFLSCSSGAYVANPSSPANESVNPLKPLTISQMKWTGTAPFSAEINGSLWVADSVSAYVATSGANVVFATQRANGSQILINFPGTSNYTLYNMGYQQNIWAMYIAPGTSSLYNDSNYYYSYLGNSGEYYQQYLVWDTLEANFYFQGVNLRNQVVNVSTGYIDYLW